MRSRPNEIEQDVIDRAIAAASYESGIPPSAIVGRRRCEAFVGPRFIVYKLCMQSGVMSQSQLGRCLGRDHGAIWNGVNSVNEWLESDDRSRSQFRDLYKRTERKYKEYESDPERMVQELSIYDG